MNTKKTQYLSRAALIAALYVVLTYVSALFGLSGGVIQLRLSEALTVLPAFTPAAVLGLTLGCFLSNLLTGCLIWDVIFGTLATLLGALGTYALKKHVWASPLPPILANALIVPFILQYVYGAEGSIWFFMLTVGIGEMLSCGVLGSFLSAWLKKTGTKLLF